jgi:hypothetical protein
VAAASKSGIKVDTIWVVVVGAGFVLGVLAKRFIKR